MLNLTHLRVFRSVLETNSITEAARQLHISQPAASKQLAELEAHVGVTLLERLPRGVRLTAAGEVLSRHARRLFQEEEAAEAALKALLGLELGQVSLAASTNTSCPLFDKASASFPANSDAPLIMGGYDWDRMAIFMISPSRNTARIRRRRAAGRRR